MSLALMIKKIAFLSNVTYQVTLILAQVILICFLYLESEVAKLDEFFHVLALLLPCYTFLLLGLRQLRLSNVLNKEVLHFVRFIALAIFVLISSLIVNEWTRVFYIVIFWKVNDLIIDAVSLELQLTKKYKMLLFLSFLRVTYFTIFIWFFNGTSTSLSFFLVPLLLLYLLYCIKVTNLHLYNRSMIKPMIYLGAVASISSLVVAYPRVVIGESENIQAGVLSLVSFVSYFYIIGQVIISAVLPIILPQVSSGKVPFEKSLKKQLFFVFTLSILFVLSVISLVGFLVLIGWDFLSNQQLLLSVLLLINLPLIFLVNFVEAFSSVCGVEKAVVISTLLTALISVALTNQIATLWNGIGYCLVIFICFLFRFLFSYYFINRSTYV